MCQALSLTGMSVEPDDLQVCHCMKKRYQDFVELALKGLNIERKSVVLFPTVKLSSK